MITDIKKLSQKLDLELIDDAFVEKLRNFPLLVPESFVKRMESKNPKDPLLLQVLPKKSELKKVPGFGVDPINEIKNSPVSGLIHKCGDRVLLLVTNACAINCRFCFRRHLQDRVMDWAKVFTYIENDPNIAEVILSGGDPLVLEPSELQKIIDRLNRIPHLKKIRIHSRLPIVLPEKARKITIKSKALVVLVVHCNHPNEINATVVKAFKSLQKQNIILFNQSVLLKGVNDRSSTLIELSEKLFAAGVIPYYLHMLDKVQGSAHFYVDMKKAKKIHLEMQERLSGYLVPKLVVEINNRKKYV